MTVEQSWEEVISFSRQHIAVPEEETEKCGIQLGETAVSVGSTLQFQNKMREGMWSRVGRRTQLLQSTCSSS